MLTTLVVLQSFSLLFTMALYGTLNRLLSALSALLQRVAIVASVPKESPSPSQSPYPWPEREN